MLDTKDMVQQKTWLHSVLFWLIAVALVSTLVAFRYVFMGLGFIKAMAFFIAVDLTVVLYGYLIIKREADLPSANWLTWTMTVWLTILGLTTIFAIHPFVSFWGSTGRVFGLVTWLHLGALFYVMVGFLRNRHEWLTLLRVIIGGSAIVVLYGLGQAIAIPFIAQAQNYRVDSLIGNAVFLAGYFTIFFPMTVISALTAETLWLKRGLWTIALLQLAVILLTASRGGLVTVVVTAIILLITWGIRYRRRGLIWISVAVIALALFTGTIVQQYADSEVVQNVTLFRRISQITLSDQTVKGRLLAWQSGWLAWQERPWLGWGLENYGVAFNLNYQPALESISMQETWVDRGHNWVIDTLVMTGLVGLAAYLALLLTALWTAWKLIYRSREKWQTAFGFVILGGLSAMVVFNLFAFDTITTLPVIGFLLALTATHANSSRPKVAGAFWGWATIVLAIMSAYFCFIQPVIVNKTVSRAIVDYYHQDFDVAFKKIDQALDAGTWLDNGIRSRLIDLGGVAYDNVQTDAELKTAVEPYLAQITELVKDTIVHEPYSAFYYNRLVSFYAKLALWDASYLSKAEDALKVLINMAPDRPGSRLTGGHLYTTVGQYAQANDYYDQAIALYPAWGEPYFHKALVAAYLDHPADTESYLNKAKELGYNIFVFDNLNVLAGIFENQSHLELAEKYRRLIVEKLPKEINGYVGLAGFYYRRGQPDLTYDYIIMALRIDPTNQTAQSLVEVLNQIDPKYKIPDF